MNGNRYGEMAVLLTSAILIGATGCGTVHVGSIATLQQPDAPPAKITSEGIIARLHRQILDEIEQHLPTKYEATTAALSDVRSSIAAFKRTLHLNVLTDPWTGITALEQLAYTVAELAINRGRDLSTLREVIDGGTAFAAESNPPMPFPTGTNSVEHLVFILSVLEQAERLRELALHDVDSEDRRFLFEHARRMVDDFLPQISALDDSVRAQARNDRRFATLIAEQVDFKQLITAAEVFARLSDHTWLARLEESFHSSAELQPPLGTGIAGTVLLVRDSPFGLIVIGGRGNNTYDLGGDVAIVIDLGGDDLYRGAIAAASKVEHGNRVVIDVSGNDRYHGSPLGLATGRLGVGFLFDQRGDDTYHMASGSGGTGFAGIGVLVDATGDDRYYGEKLTQGAAIGGIGLLIDETGDDEYTSFGYAVGFGGPLGIGAVVDGNGDDRYQCGEAYPSEYNAAENQDSTPGDPRFQYTGFCLGVGSGRRIVTDDDDESRFDLAGGLGLLLDLQGDDRYQSANFSQGTGYFHGAGIKLDADGNDDHQAARYGHGAAAHGGIGLFIDASGDDRYGSTGPVYNGATAWDRSVAFFVDAGKGADTYDLSHSDGLGRADHDSFSVFIDEGGRDRYLVRRGTGAATNNSVSGFFDLGGCDDYVVTPEGDADARGNGTTAVNGEGGLFVDRSNCEE